MTWEAAIGELIESSIKPTLSTEVAIVCMAGHHKTVSHRPEPHEIAVPFSDKC
jgi:hypothetical protein